LALRTVPIAAAGVTDALMTTAVALLDMATERGGAANLDRRHHPALRGGHRSTVLLTIGAAVAAEYIRHFRP